MIFNLLFLNSILCFENLQNECSTTSLELPKITKIPKIPKPIFITTKKHFTKILHPIKSPFTQEITILEPIITSIQNPDVSTNIPQPVVTNSVTTNIPQPDVTNSVSTNIPQPVNGLFTKATFYFRVGDDVPGCPSVQTFNDGISYGPCKSEDGSSGVKYTSNSKYWAAIANAASRCGETITVSYNGKSMQLKVMDECPACQEDNHVDMGLDALIELTGSKEAACAINRPLPMITWS